MNDHLKTGFHGLRLIKQFEKGPVNKPGVRVTKDGAALDAYLCPAGKPTLSFGVCTHPDGTPVRLGDSIREDQVDPYLQSWLVKVEDQIKRTVTSRLNQNQFDGLVSWVFNLGIGNLKATVNGQSQLLPLINTGKWRDAASRFGLFVYSTTRASDGHLWKRAMFGLFIRRCCEACLVLGYDWEYACDPDRLALPTRRDWQPDWKDPNTGEQGRYYDVVLIDGKTPFDNIERDAMAHPLPDPSDSLLFDTPPQIATGSPPISTVGFGSQRPASAQSIPASLPTSIPAPNQSSPGRDAEPAGTPPIVSPAGGAGPAGVSQPVQQPLPAQKPPPAIAAKTVDINAIPYGEVDPANGAKNITDSKRFAGMLIVGAGSVVQVLATRGVVTTTAGAVFFDMTRDPVLIALIVGGIFWGIAILTKKRGKKVITDGMVNATQVLK